MLPWSRKFAPVVRRPARRRNPVSVELLEGRDVPALTMHPAHLMSGPSGIQPLATAGPTGMTPTQIRHAYGFDQISFDGVNVADGSNTTIAIVDAYDDPRIANDLHQFDVKFGLADPPSFKKVNQTGGSTMPAADGGWASEIALDVEWAHAIAPRANILLVEAKDASDINLYAAVRYAASQPNVVAVSMSWGGSEYLGEASDDATFKTPTGHTGVTFLVAAGDSGAPAEYPSSSPNVVSVGGTSLKVTSAGAITSESGWSGSGGGISSYETQPTYQKGVVAQSTTRRTTPDVSYDADPNTGFPVYDTYNNAVSAPWDQFGGTSDAAPQWAALVAIADQGRIAAGLAPLDGVSQTLPMLYSMAATNFHDITTGTSTGNPRLTAGAGYDLVTGRGSPFADRVVAALAGTAISNPAPTAVSFSISAPAATAGNSFTITVSALDSTGKVLPSYTGAVSFTSSDSTAILPANYTFNANDKGVHTFTVTLNRAGSQTVTATDSTSGITGTVTVSVSPASPAKVVFVQQPTSGAPGVVLAPVTVAIVDTYGNQVTTDNADTVTIALGNNPAGGTLSGTLTATVAGGLATFSNLSIDAAGSGYTLAASATGLTGATSTSFNIVAGPVTPGTTIVDFEKSSTWYLSSGWSINAARTSAAAHDGTYGLDQWNSNQWIYRTDSAVQLKAGDTASVWLKFAGSADGRAYFGFGSSSSGTLSLVAAPNSGQLILQSNFGYGAFNDLAAVNTTYASNHWYRLEVDWSTSGVIVGKLFDSDGVTPLAQVNASTTTVTAGGIAFRATGSDKYWDTVTVVRGVNTFTSPPPTTSATTTGSIGTTSNPPPPATGGASTGGTGSSTGGTTTGGGTSSSNPPPTTPPSWWDPWQWFFGW